MIPGQDKKENGQSGARRQVARSVEDERKREFDMPTKKTGAADAPQYIEIDKVGTETIRVRVIGTSPLICNRLAEKARQELLLPSAKKNSADKQASLKHIPIDEFRSSIHRMNDESPTLLGMPTTAFKGAIRTAAMDLPGTSKAQIGRLVWIPNEYVSIWGVPEVFVAMVRQKDMNRTPDVRTRAIVRHWVAEYDVRFVSPILKAQGVYNLIAASGVYIGVGDFRQEKGAGSFGSFELVSGAAAERQFAKIQKECGRKAQIAAMQEATPYDAESAELLRWWTAEVPKRGFKTTGERDRATTGSVANIVTAPTKRPRKGNGHADAVQ